MRRVEGFTLVELMIVVAIVGILGALAVPTWAAMAAHSRQSEARINLQGIFTLEQTFFAEHTTYGSLAEIGFTPEGASRYGYCAGASSCVAASAPLDYGASDPASTGHGGGAGFGDFGLSATNGLGTDDSSSGGGTDAGIQPGDLDGFGGGGPASGTFTGGTDPFGNDLLNGHYDASSFEVDALGRISSQPSPHDFDVWFADDKNEIVNIVIGY